jgi:L-seryl-tRNA(Ser) seleniumtransferase
VAEAVRRAQRSALRAVINATGVVLHTNLGRARLARQAVEAIDECAMGYSNLEYDIDSGARGSRYSHCVELLRELTGAEDAIVVNNNAAALVLALNALASGRGVVISRGELVEIGGSFRIPEIMERSGARLVEVGTTNRTHASDYEQAIGASVAAVMKVHRSNFAMEGFVAEVGAQELGAIARRHSLPFVHDLGSGLLISLEQLGLTGEPTAAQAVRAAGAGSLVTMSGDKLLGGPQAGIVVGARDLVRRLRENPLARSLRVDKLTLAALSATLALYRDPERAMRDIPVLEMLGRPVSQLRQRAARLIETIGRSAAMADTEASVGGGAFPGAKIPSMALAFARDAAALETRLRRGDPPVIGRVAEDTLLLDLRTVRPEDDSRLAAAVRAATGT